MYYKHKLQTLTIRVSEPNASMNDCASSSRKAEQFIKPLLDRKDSDQEHFGVLFVNSQNEITGFKFLFSGGMQDATVDIRVIFRNGLGFGATGMICFHNHPSGDCKPSNEDEQITEKIVQASKIIGIKVLDHIVVGTLANGSYFSFADEGLIKRYYNSTTGGYV